MAATVIREPAVKEPGATAAGTAWAGIAGASDVPPRVGVPVDARLYWIGTLPGNPRQNVAISGISFPAFSEILEDQGYVTQRHKRAGGLVWLSPERVERVKTAIADRVVRTTTTGNPATGVLPIRVVVSMTGNYHRPYVPYVDDEPLGKYLYLIDVESAAKKIGPLWRDEAPPPLTA